MTVEADVFSLLAPLVSGRVFPDIAPPNTQLPYMTYQQIGGAVVTFIDPAIPSKKNGAFQINVWAGRRAEASALALAVETAMLGATAFQARPMAALLATNEPSLSLYGTIQEFSIWSER
jgi:hypothetical protein